ncbi:unnamed protein product, partial [Scytosiphon promiscuus]
MYLRAPCCLASLLSTARAISLLRLGATEDALRLLKRLGSNLILANNPWVTP